MKPDFGIPVEKLFELWCLDDGYLAGGDGLDRGAVRFVVEKAGMGKLMAFEQFAKSRQHLPVFRNFHVRADRDFSLEYHIDFISFFAFDDDQLIRVVIFTAPKLPFHKLRMREQGFQRTGLQGFKHK